MSDYEAYNVGRAARGRAPIQPRTFGALQNVEVFAKDMEGWIAGSTVIRAALMVKASEVKDYWQSIAPQWGDKDPKKDSPKPFAAGAYRDSIKIVATGGSIKVGSDLPGLSEWLEYGSIHNPEHGYGARVLAHFGGGSPDEAERVTDKLFVG